MPLLVGLALVLVVPAAQARPAIGMNMDVSDIQANHLKVEDELKLAVAAGVERVRFPLYWSNIQSRRDAPYDWSDLDGLVRAASRLHLELRPVLTGAPRWAARDLSVTSPVTKTLLPANYSEFARFAEDLSSRYGSGGTFTRSEGTLPISTWQVWNEPDHALFWPQVVRSGCLKQKPAKPAGGRVWTITRNGRKCWYSEAPISWSIEYVKMLQAVRGAKSSGTSTVNGIRPGTGLLGGDSRAKVMLASFTSFTTSIGNVYSAIASREKSGPNAGRARFGTVDPADFFDAVGINVFPSRTRLTDYGSKIRALVASMKRNGDANGDSPRAPITLTEFAWLSGRCGFTERKCSKLKSFGSLGALVTTSADQGVLAARSLAYLTDSRNRLPLEGAYWFTWITTDRSADRPWAYAGLRCFSCSTRKPAAGQRRAPANKPSMALFMKKALAIEGCRMKVLADRCTS